MTTGKTMALTIWIFISKMSLLFNLLSRFVIAFLPRSKFLLISWLQSPSAVISEPKKIKAVTVSIFFPIYFPWRDGTICQDLHFLKLSFKPTFSLSSFPFIKRLFSSSSLSAIRVVSSAYLRLFLMATLISACASSMLTYLMFCVRIDSSHEPTTLTKKMHIPPPLQVKSKALQGSFIKYWVASNLTLEAMIF